MSAVHLVEGFAVAGFEPVRDAFAANFADQGEVGAACCAIVNGRVVADLAAGHIDPSGSRPYTPDTLQCVFSTTKGAVSICAHILAERGRLDFDAPVAEYWPEFGAANKDRVSVRWLLSHQAGLAAVDQPLTMEMVYAWDPVIAALAAQLPNWHPGSGHGYHAVTFGWLVGEVVRRVSGASVGEFFEREVARPLELDFWIGLPEAQETRVAPVLPAPPPAAGDPPDPFLARLMDPSTLMHRVFTNPGGVLASVNTREFRAVEIPAANGMATARSIARMYAACIDEVDGIRLLSPKTLAAAMVEQVDGEDLVLGYQTRYGLGFQLSFPYRPMADEGSFGHYGMGGSVGFAHPERGLAFGYVMNQMRSSTGVDPRPDALVQALRACL